MVDHVGDINVIDRYTADVYDKLIAAKMYKTRAIGMQKLMKYPNCSND